MQVAGHDTLTERSRTIVEELGALDDEIDRYQYLVEQGERVPRLPASERTDANRLRGCQYGVWIRSDYDPDRGVLHFRVDSDARIVLGLAALILRVLDGLPPSTIAHARLDFLDATGLRAHLSAQRTTGLAAMVQEMQARARHHVDTGHQPA
jgi:cysteine desulfuration protein SufE